MPDIKFYYQIVLWSGEVIIVKINTAAHVQEAIDNGAKHVTITQGGKDRTLAIGDIRDVSESDRTIDPKREQRMIESGDVSLRRQEPLINPKSGDIKWAWAKKIVSKKKYDSYYSSAPGYFFLKNEYERIWIGFRKILVTNQVLPDDVLWCDKVDSKKLDDLFKRTTPH